MSGAAFLRLRRMSDLPETVRLDPVGTCGLCRRWMRYDPAGSAAPLLRRRVPPHGSRCVRCPVEAACRDGCAQCRNIQKSATT